MTVYVVVGWWASGDAYEVLGVYGNKQGAEAVQEAAFNGHLVPFDNGSFDGADIYPVEMDAPGQCWPDLPSEL